MAINAHPIKPSLILCRIFSDSALRSDKGTDCVMSALVTHRHVKTIVILDCNSAHRRLSVSSPRAIRAMASFTNGEAGGLPVKVYNPEGKFRVIVTKDLPGQKWLEVLVGGNARVEVRAHAHGIIVHTHLLMNAHEVRVMSLSKTHIY